MVCKQQLCRLASRAIFDRLGHPALEVVMGFQGGLVFRSTVPYNPRVGDRCDFREVNEAANLVNNVFRPQLKEQVFDVTDQTHFDCVLTNLHPKKCWKPFDSSAFFAVSAAFCKAGAAAKGLELYKYIAELAEVHDPSLPVPSFNTFATLEKPKEWPVFIGFSVMPIGAERFADAYDLGCEVLTAAECNLAQELRDCPPLPKEPDTNAYMYKKFMKNTVALSSIHSIMERLDNEVKLQLVVHFPHIFGDFRKAPYFYDDECCPIRKCIAPKELNIRKPAGKTLSEMLLERYRCLLKSNHHILSIEDPFDLDEFAAWRCLTTSTKLQIVIDEATLWGEQHLERMIKEKSANTIVVHPQYFATLTKTMEICRMARFANWQVNVNADYYDFDDTFIADFAVGVCAAVFRAGAPSKYQLYDRLVAIETHMGECAPYALCMRRQLEALGKTC